MMSTATNANKTVQQKPGHLQERQDALEKRLKDTLALRATLQAKIKACQAELNRLFRDCPNRPRDTVEEIDQRMAKLERARTIVSMPLNEEKVILKQIHKLQRSKAGVQEYLAVDAKIKDKKNQVADLRTQLGATGSELTAIRNELSPVRTANQLGCNVEELLGMKVPCPPEKLGQVIGKKGKNIQQLTHKANVTVDIEKANDGAGDTVRIVGSMKSLDMAMMDLDKVISKTEESLPVPAELVQYWTAKGISALAELQQSHPDVRMDVVRHKTDVRFRGMPSDIATCKEDVLAAVDLVTSQTMAVTSKEASLVVGKHGSTVDALVASHQTAIDVSRKNESDNDSTITLVGPSGHVEAARREIQELLDANKEVERVVNIEPYIKTTLLMESGKGIQALFQKVNENKSSGLVGVNFADDQSIVVKGKQRFLDVALEVVQAEISSLEAMVVRLTVDPAVIPVFIGKGGKGVKALKGDRNVSIEFNRDAGEVIICGLDEKEIQIVAEEARALADKHIVERVSFDPSQYKSQIKEFYRNKAKEINAICHSRGDEEKMELVLRGSRGELDKAVVLVKDFLAHNHFEELQVTDADIQALLTGGKKSKIVELAKETGVQLNMERDRQSVQAKGEKEKVGDAVKKIRAFLYGGEGISLTKIPLEKDVIGTVIGKGGKHIAELEKKYESLSIMMGRTDDVMTLRGAEADVEACRLEILKLIATARVTQVLTLSEEKAQALEKSRVHRRLVQSIPVQISLKGTTVTIRGVKDDVHDAVAAIEEQCGKPYQVGYFLDESLFRRVKDTWRDPASLKRIQNTSGSKVFLDEKKSAVLFSGKRPAVKKAKGEVLKFFEFLFASQIRRLDLAPQLLVSLGKSGSIADVVALSGARIFIDRDLSAVLIFTSNEEQGQKAKDALQSAMDKETKLVSVLQLDKDEDWLVPLLLGKNGSRIKSLRKQTGCRLDINSSERRLTISADDEDKVSRAKGMVNDMLDKARRECQFVSIPDGHMAAFVGRSGVHIKEFSKKHGVEIQLMKKGSSIIRITGVEDAVAACREAAEEWIETRTEKLKEEQAFVAVTLKKDQIPIVIGPKGSVIRSLEKEFRCKIDVDRKAFVVSIRGARRKEALEKVKQVASTDQDEAIVDGSDTSDAPAVDSEPNETSANKQPKKRTGRQKPVAEEKASQRIHETASLGESNFPVLSDSVSKATEVSTTKAAKGSSWASLLKGQAENGFADEEVPEVELNDDEEATAVVAITE